MKIPEIKEIYPDPGFYFLRAKMLELKSIVFDAQWVNFNEK